MSEFTEAYRILLLKQYYNKPNASGEASVISGTWEAIKDAINQFAFEFDVDNATGDRLDKIGKIVGVPRSVPFVLEKIRFGFDGDPTAKGFADVFDPLVESAPFRDLFEQQYTTQQLDDNDYRFFIKAKIAVNQTSAYMVSDEYVSLQDAIDTAFNGQAYAIDNQDMSLTLNVGSGVDRERLRLIRRLGLLPKPQAVRYKFVLQAETDSFGFDNDPNAKCFGDVFDSTVGGSFASLVI